MTEQVIGNTPQISDYLLTDDYNVNSSDIGASSACVKNAVDDVNDRIDSVVNMSGAYVGAVISMLCADTYVPLGTVPMNGAEYTAATLPTFYNTFLVGGKLLTCTYTEWSTQVGLTGNCAKFALDTDNQKFKVPLLKDGDSITHAASAAEIGKSVEAGLPNITGTFEPWSSSANPTNAATGAFKIIGWGNNNSRTTGSAGTQSDIFSFDPSRVSSVYGNSNTVTDEQVRLRHFVVVANVANISSVFDWSEYMSALAGKANNDLTNLTSDGKYEITTLTAPRAQNIALSLPEDGATTIAPGNGFLHLEGNNPTAAAYCALLNTTTGLHSRIWAYGAGHTLNCFIPVAAGNVVQVWCNTGPPKFLNFIPVKGN